MPQYTFDDEVVDDAVAALAQVAARSEFDRVYVVGHSIGAMLAPRIAARASAKGIAVRGVVMLAAPATPLQDVIVEQYTFLAGLPVPRATPDLVEDMKARRANVARLLERGPLDPEVARLTLPLDMPASAWLDIGRYDPVATLLAQPRLPALLLFAGRDFQVPVREKEKWAVRVNQRPDTTLVVFPDLNHLLIEGVGPMTPDEYGRPGRVFQPLIDLVGLWIRDH